MNQFITPRVYPNVKTTKGPARSENSVVLAFAELDRLERDRADFAHAKREANERLAGAHLDIRDLRERLDAARPRAWARVRRAKVLASGRREQVRANARARTEIEHQARLAERRTALEAQRSHLAALESIPTVERPGRRLLEWSIPTAATALVAVFGFALFGGEPQAEAHLAQAPEAMFLAEASPEFENTEPELVIEAESKPEPVLVAAPEPTPESSTKPKPKPKASTKPKTKTKTKPKTSTKPKPKTSSTPSTARKVPLILGGNNGNPLG